MCETRASGPHQLWRLPELLGIIAGYCARSDLVTLGLVCKDWHSVVGPRLWRRVRLEPSTGLGCVKYRHWIVAVESPLCLVPLLTLLPNLRELVLHGVKNLDDTLPTLFDLNISVLKIRQERDTYSDWNWNFRWGSLVDRVSARSFLHRLVSIDFGAGIHGTTAESTIIRDAIHKKLRKIDFGANFRLPIDLLSAPHHLTVLCSRCPETPETFFRIIADHCPHLRALSCPDMQMGDDLDSHWAVMRVESFRYFMTRRGAQLVALEFSLLQGDIEPLFGAMMCHS
ncbi:hypothetical protein HK102_008828, partial [Quaeritorhiza haematococci]